jgi:glycosyltransferase involved in cell wall biosynthesis
MKHSHSLAVMEEEMQAKTKRPYLSIVIPLYNEEENIETLQKKLNESLGRIGSGYEIIYVDDGSKDRSFIILSRIAKEDKRVKVIKFRKNYGQTAAMSAGFDAAQGDVIIPLDADLQNDPADIPKLLEKIDEGYDVVSGWRKNRQDKFWSRQLPSVMANRLISSITGVRLHDYGCSLKAYRAEIIKNVKLYGEMHRFIPAFSALEGGLVTEIAVNHHPRLAGKSKYGLSRTFKVFLDLIVVKFFTDYAKKPIHLFGSLGLLTFFFGFLSAVIAVYQRIFNNESFTSSSFLVLAVVFSLFALQSVLLGLLGEVAIRTHHESPGKKIYTVAKTVNIEVLSHD